MPLDSAKILHGVAWNRTWATMVRGLQLATCYMCVYMLNICHLLDISCEILYEYSVCTLQRAQSTLPFIIFYSPKELSKRRMLVRMAAHSLVLLSILLFFAQLWDWISLNNPKEVVVFILSILVIYIVVFATNSFRDKKLADKLNEKLQKRYHSQE